MGSFDPFHVTNLKLCLLITATAQLVYSSISEGILFSYRNTTKYRSKLDLLGYISFSTYVRINQIYVLT